MEVIPIIVGILFSIAGIIMIVDTYKFREVALETIGKILGYEQHQSTSNNRTSTLYTPVIEFTHQNEDYRFKATISTTNMSYDIGQDVTVLFKDGAPNDARLKTNLRYFLGTIFAVMGIIALIIGILNFQFDKFSMIVSFIILLSVLFKGYTFKSKMNAQGIFTIDELMNYVKMNKKKKQSDSEDEIDLFKDENYQPTAEMISTEKEKTQVTKIPKWLPYTFMLIGVITVVAGGVWIKDRSAFLDSALVTSGKVISFESSTSDGSTVYYPIVTFIEPRTNRSIKFKHSTGSSNPSWSRGDKVEVMFDPTNAKNAMIDDGLYNWFGPVFLMLIGALFLMSGWFYSKKKS